MKTMKDFQFKNKVVLIRSDLNVPIENGIITDDNRIRESVETIGYIVNQGGKAVVFSHLGRVKNEEDKLKYTLKPVANRLNELIYEEVIFVPHTKGLELENTIKNANFGTIIVVENTRFEDMNDKKESSNDEKLGKYWASLGEIFINDAFGTSHRSHASNVGISKHLPSGIGYLMQKELEAFNLLIKEEPDRDYVVILGGAKVKDKIPLIESLVQKADKVLIGGGMCYTFFKSQGLQVGRSIVDEESIDFCAKILRDYPGKIILPIDINVGNEFSVNATIKTKEYNRMAAEDMGMDIGIKTVRIFTDILEEAKTVFWNGPLGVFEFPRFNKGTVKIAEKLNDIKGKVIVGGGDTVAAINQLGIKNKYYHISTGGGAALELIEGKTLPAVAAIEGK